MRRTKKLMAAGILALLFLGVCTLLFWEYRRDPLLALPRPEHGLQAEPRALAVQDHRLVEHLTLPGSALGDINFSLSLPEPRPPKKLPVVLVLGGLVTGENSVLYIKDAGENVIVGYSWPIPTRLRGVGTILKAPDLYHSVMAIPGQVVSVLNWLVSQPWADPHRISLVGFSQGALAVPAAQDLAAQDGTRIGWTIIAYGGAPLGTVLAANPHMKPVWLGHVLAPLIDLVFHCLEPTVHLPRLSGKFLVLEGRDDRLIPQAARNFLQEAVPEPKTVISIEGNHMGVGPEKMALLQKIIKICQTWLIDNGAINPGPD
jgi:hypothetical protein